MKIVDTVNSYFDMLKQLEKAPVLYCDTEATGLDPYRDRLLLVQVHDGLENYIIDFLALDLSLLKVMQFVFESDSIVKVFHNAVFDWKMLRHNGGFDTRNMHCTLVTDQMVNAGLVSGYSLADVAMRRLGIVVDKSVREQFINRDITVPFTKEELEYAAFDTEILIPIYQQQLKEIKAKELERVYDLECHDLNVTGTMEYTGMLVDKERIEIARPLAETMAHKAELGLQDAFIELGAAQQIVFTKDGYSAINTAGWQQKLKAFQDAGINVKSTRNGELSEWDILWAAKNNVVVDQKEIARDISLDEDDDNDVSAFHHPLLKKHDVKAVATKLKNTFLDGIYKSINPVTHRCHPGFNQCGAAATGRYSSSGPNFQNMIKPAKIESIGLDSRCFVRPVFIATPGWSFIIADYSGIELAVLAIMSGDQQLIDQVLKGDIHSYVANNLEGERIKKLTGSEIVPKNKKLKPWEVFRDSFKKVNYSIAYGTSEFGMHKKQYMQLASVGMPITVKDTKRWLDTWKYELFPGVGALLNKNAEYAITRRYTESVLGRKRFWPENIRDNKWTAMAAMREGMNQPIQSSSADMTKQALRMVYERIDKREARIVATVHDEIILEVHTERAEYYKELTGRTMKEAGYVLFPHAQEGLILVDVHISDRYDK